MHCGELPELALVTLHACLHARGPLSCTRLHGRWLERPAGMRAGVHRGRGYSACRAAAAASGAGQRRACGAGRSQPHGFKRGSCACCRSTGAPAGGPSHSPAPMCRVSSLLLTRCFPGKWHTSNVVPIRCWADSTLHGSRDYFASTHRPLATLGGHRRLHAAGRRRAGRPPARARPPAWRRAGWRRCTTPSWRLRAGARARRARTPRCGSPPRHPWWPRTRSSGAPRALGPPFAPRPSPVINISACQNISEHVRARHSHTGLSKPPWTVYAQ